MFNDISDLQRTGSGDVQAFERLFKRYYAPLCIYASAIIGEREAGEEIVQELFYVLWKDRERLPVLQSVKGYLYGSVRNRAIQYCEHRAVVDRHSESVQAAPEQHTPTPHEMMEYTELERLIRQTLEALPPRRLLIFQMQREEGKKYAEIASELSLSVKTVEAEMTKALQALRKVVEKYNRQQ